MAFFVNWYVGLLKTRPMLANMGSALVLMSAGDVMAQELEFNNFGVPDNASKETDKRIRSEARHLQQQQQKQEQRPHELSQRYYERRVSLRRYGTDHSDHFNQAEETKIIVNDDDSKEKKKTRKFFATMIAKAYNNDWLESTLIMYEEVRSIIVVHVNELNFFRTGTMIGWAVFAYTPFYVGVYKVFDHYMPKQTPATVAVRVGICALLAIPLNAAFFAYGTMVHHTSDWVADVADFEEQQRHQKQQKGDFGDLEWIGNMIRLIKKHVWQEDNKICRSNGVDKGDMLATAEPTSQLPPFDLPLMCSTIYEKLSTELLKTVGTSAVFWIPINYLNFTHIPTHLRPVTLMVCSVFWNCYLSLAQHRDVTIHDNYVEDSEND